MDIMAKDIMAADSMATDIMAMADVASQAAAAPPTCKEAAKLQFPTDRKARRAYRHECKLAWKAQKAPKA